MGALPARRGVDRLCSLGNGRGRKERNNNRQRKRGNRKLLCLYPDEHLQSADFKTCKKILGLNCNTDKPFRTLRKSSRVKNRELRGKP